MLFQKELYNGIPNAAVLRVTWNTIVKLFWNTLHYEWKWHWSVTTAGKTRYPLLYYDSSKHCTCPLNKCICIRFQSCKPLFETHFTLLLLLFQCRQWPLIPDVSQMHL
jgi:hypothetical protein